jgi:hypothetical protein
MTPDRPGDTETWLVDLPATSRQRWLAMEGPRGENPPRRDRRGRHGRANRQGEITENLLKESVGQFRSN